MWSLLRPMSLRLVKADEGYGEPMRGSNLIWTVVGVLLIAALLAYLGVISVH